MTEARIKVPDEVVEAAAWQKLKDVFDPELGVNLVDLGLVYVLTVEEGGVLVKMSLTTPGCPMSDSMLQAVERALVMIPGVVKVAVDLVWDPRWEPSMMSERAKRELGWL